MKLDLIKSASEALALAQQKNDFFYHRAYLIQRWLTTISINALAGYAARPATGPAMQTGEAFRALAGVFGCIPESKVPYLAADFLRFSSSGHPFAPLLRKSHEFLVPELRHPSSDRHIAVAYQVAECLHLCRRNAADAAPDADPEEEKRVAMHFWQLITRWCAWLDSATHYQAYALFTIAPILLDPDHGSSPAVITADVDYLFREIRQSRIGWLWHHRPSQSNVASTSHAFSSSRGTHDGGCPLTCNDPWPLRLLDTCLIRLYPLAVRFNWSATDLLTALRGVLGSDLYFSANDLQAYCRNCLGLYGLSPRPRSGSQQPPASDLAPVLCPPTQPTLGNPPWS